MYTTERKKEREREREKERAGEREREREKEREKERKKEGERLFLCECEIPKTLIKGCAAAQEALKEAQCPRGMMLMKMISLYYWI